MKKLLTEWRKFLKEDREEYIPGGLTSKLKGSMDDVHRQIAAKHKVPLTQIEKEIQKGIKVEMEHTSDPKVAHEIAMDHVYEDPEYYSKLQAVEK